MLKFRDVCRGDVVRILYFLVQNKFRKIFVFCGVCTNLKKHSATFSLQNYHGRELVEVSFIFSSPFIISLEKLSSYNFSKSLRNLSHLKNYKVSYWNDRLLVQKPISKFDPYDYLYNAVSDISERRRLRRKFRI